mmetsp:Transcript_64318/g.73837  ORF Transcript_64318/g.73837 Transcript_64318/m.73837 type:complete len:477 (+) Transcript_64318:59-1489(+)
MVALFILVETASGYGLFKKEEFEEIAQETEQVKQSVLNFGRFSKIIKFKAFTPFKSAEQALRNITAISDGEISEDLKTFLENNLPSPSKKAKWTLGVEDSRLGTALTTEMSLSCVANVDTVFEIIRGIRCHFTKFVKELEEEDLNKARLGLAHSYSRSKVSSDINRTDKPIIQCIALLDQLDKDINTFAMRIREWYSWHFPELARVVTDNKVYCEAIHIIKKRSEIENNREELEELIGDSDLVQQIVDSSKTSMGLEISDMDMENITKFTTRVVELAQFRKDIHGFLTNKMNAVAPNVTALMGETIGARLISHSGGIRNLAKAPASTVQILGAEKALFRALKSRGNTPKYGLIFNSTYIGRAETQHKGRISRFLANKCSMAARIDHFLEKPTNRFGEEFKQQVENRLDFFAGKSQPLKNDEIMTKVMKELKEDNLYFVQTGEDNGSDEKKSKKEKKEKKDKKKKKSMEIDSDSSSD